MWHGDKYSAQRTAATAAHRVEVGQMSYGVHDSHKVLLHSKCISMLYGMSTTACSEVIIVENQGWTWQ